jgi:hypothetical protein
LINSGLIRLLSNYPIAYENIIHSSHQPSQFTRPAIQLASDSSNKVVLLSRENLDIQLPNVRVVGFHESDAETVKADKFSAKVVAGSLRATAVASVCLVLKQQGFTPDIIVAHSGWGD